MPDEETPVRATDALANERTFLAYLRTALALVAFGFVIARFALFGREFATITGHAEISSGTTSILLGASMAIAGVVTALFGAWRYLVAARGLDSGRVVPLARGPVMISSIAVALVCLVVAIDLILVR
jgi:putative membrane protein